MSTVTDIPLNIELKQLFFLNSLKLNGHPFFNISFALAPSNSIIALDWDRSVTAKSVSLNFFSNSFFTKLFFCETKSQFFGPFHKIRVSLLLLTLRG